MAGRDQLTIRFIACHWACDDHLTPVQML
uniref:Uncharacterized protein n=1 Tax=mine drainage metagenome TaxID=410659 RepID=E6QBR4_9ZZZZ